MNAPDKLSHFIALTREPLSEERALNEGMESMSEEFKRAGGETTFRSARREGAP